MQGKQGGVGEGIHQSQPSPAARNSWQDLGPKATVHTTDQEPRESGWAGWGPWHSQWESAGRRGHPSSVSRQPSGQLKTH